MAEGKVKWFSSTKGYGFIQPNDGSGDVFVHVTAIEKAGIKNLNEGQVVAYELVTERGKTAASDIRLLD